MTIHQFINQYKIEDRDKKVKEAIGQYMSDNIDAINDGLYKHFISFGNSSNKKLLDIYNLDDKEWKKFQKTNPELQKDFQISKDTLKLCLLTSYADTKDPLFLEFIMLIFAGSKFNHYLRYRDSKAYEGRMRYAIEYIIPGKSFIKKQGNLYGGLQMSTASMIDSDANKKFLNHLDKDHSMTQILGRMRTMVNDMIKRIRNAFEMTKNKDNVIFFNKDIDTGEGDVLEVKNNSTFVRSIKFILNDYSPSEYDYGVLKILNLTDPESKFLTLNILKNNGDIFDKLAELYLQYYMDNYFVSTDKFKSDYIQKMVTARMNNPVMTDIDNKLYAICVKILDKYREDNKVMIYTRQTEINKYIKKFKNYVIIKTRTLANKI